MSKRFLTYGWCWCVIIYNFRVNFNDVPNQTAKALLLLLLGIDIDSSCQSAQGLAQNQEASSSGVARPGIRAEPSRLGSTRLSSFN